MAAILMIYQNSCSLNSIEANQDHDQFKLPAKHKTVRSQGVPFAFHRRYGHGFARLGVMPYRPTLSPGHVAVRALSSLHQETDADAGGTGVVSHHLSEFDCSLGLVLFPVQ